MPTQDQLDRLHAVVPAAKLCAQLFGVPASVTLAQWIVESSWGASQLAVKANNCFGVKYSQKGAPETYMEFPTAEYVNGKKEVVEALFVKYASVADSFKGHAQLLSRAARYRPAMAVAHDVTAFAAELQKCGYSTNSNYAKGLDALVAEFHLTQYDAPSPEPAAAAVDVQPQEIAA